MIAAPPRTRFGLPERLVARVPPEARGLERDGVRLLAAGGDRPEHARFRDLTRFLRAGDVLVVNTSATLAAAVDGRREGGDAVTVHFSTALGESRHAVELRPPGRATGPVDDALAGELLSLPGGVRLRLEAPWPDPRPTSPRLWRVRAEGDVPSLLARHGRPIAYAYVDGRWPIELYQTVFGRFPGSAEMPSAGRPFSHRLVTELVAAGVAFAPVLLHAGVSSLEEGEPPLPEPFRVTPSTAARVMAARAAGGRVIAVGTTAARAIETVASEDGGVREGEGWTELVLGRERPSYALDGIITGWHAPGASHLALLEAVVGEEVVARAYEEALGAGYLWHEFGDATLLLR